MILKRRETRARKIKRLAWVSILCLCPCLVPANTVVETLTKDGNKKAEKTYVSMPNWKSWKRRSPNMNDDHNRLQMMTYALS